MNLRGSGGGQRGLEGEMEGRESHKIKKKTLKNMTHSQEKQGSGKTGDLDWD